MITYRDIKGTDLTPDEVDANFRDLALGKANISVYDPTSKNTDAFAMDSMVEGTTTKILTDTERTAISTNSTKVSNVSHPLVEKAVPVGAVFTDTVYNDTAIQSQVDDKLNKTTEIQAFVSLTQAAYDAIVTPSTTTIYFIE